MDDLTALQVPTYDLNYPDQALSDHKGLFIMIDGKMNIC